MRKAILITTCLMGMVLHSQNKADKKTTFKTGLTKSDGVFFYRPIKYIKFSFKPDLDIEQAYSLLTDGETNFSDLTADDYLSVENIDIRMKIYLIPRVSFVMGGKFSGLSGYSMNSGIIIKLN